MRTAIFCAKLAAGKPMFKLPNGNKIDTEMLEMAMQDANLTNIYFLDTKTGEIPFRPEYNDLGLEPTLEELHCSERYIKVPSIPSHKAYQWRKDFVVDKIEPEDSDLAEKFYIALEEKALFAVLIMCFTLQTKSGLTSGTR